eukprot:13077385-Alexandrium_andersonii.AAC.1
MRAHFVEPSSCTNGRSRLPEPRKSACPCVRCRRPSPLPTHAAGASSVRGEPMAKVGGFKTHARPRNDVRQH